MGGQRFNRCFTGVSVGIMALMIAACAETSVGGLPNPSVNAAAQSGAERAASADSIIGLADDSRAAGDRVTAISLYHRAALAAPKDAAVQIKTGFMLHELGAFAEADGAFRRALVIAPRNAEALRGLGIALVARDMPHHAVENLEAAIAASGDPRAYNALGVARDMTGDRAAAQQAYAAGLERDPGNLTLLNNLGLSLALSGRLDEAIAVLGRVTASADATPRHRQNLALAYGLAGRPDLAADVSNNDLDMRDVRNNLGYYAWLRDRPAHENSVSATLSAPAPAARAGAMTAEAVGDAPPPLVAAPMVLVEGVAAEPVVQPIVEPAAPPLPIAPLAPPAGGLQTADTGNSSPASGTNETIWELTGTVDETPAKDQTKTPVGEKPAPAAPAPNAGPDAEEGANAALETAIVDEALSAPSAPGLSDAIAQAIIAAPADAPAENLAAAFDGSAYSRRLENAPEIAPEIAAEIAAEIAGEDTPASEMTVAVEAVEAAPSVGMTATDMNGEDWATANKATADLAATDLAATDRAESVAAPSTQLAMMPEDAASDGARDTASDMAPGMIAAADSDSVIDHESNSDSAVAAPGETGAGQSAEVATIPTEPERRAPRAHAPHPATGPPSAAQPVTEADDIAANDNGGDGTAGDEAAGVAESAAGAGQSTDVATIIAEPERPVPREPAHRELARTDPEPAGAAYATDAGPASQGAETGRNGNAPATDPATGPTTDPGGGPATGPLAEPGDRPATSYPYAEPSGEQRAQPPTFGTAPDTELAAAPTRNSSLAGASMGSASMGSASLGSAAATAATLDSGPNVVMLAALGAAMFLIMALLALGRLRQRTGVPEPE